MTARPTTTAGRALLEATRKYLVDTRLWDKDAALNNYREAILAIEAEASQPDSEALRWRLTGSLTVLTEWAEGEEGEGCHWCLFSEGHAEDCPVGETRAVLNALLRSGMEPTA